MGIYPARRGLRDDHAYMAADHLKEMVQHLHTDMVAVLLDSLTAGLVCTCGHADYDCHCRVGISKVAGVLLDRYFDTADGPHAPDRVWGWVKSLWYDGRGDAERNAGIRVVAADNELRHQLHLRAFEGITTEGPARDARYHLFDGHHHSGLTFQDGDDWRMADHAFESDNPGLWSAFWSRPQRRNDKNGPNELRRHMREHANAKPAFAAEWARRQRNFRAWRRDQQQRWERNHRRWGKRDQQRAADSRAQLEARRDQVESGKHWSWIDLFARFYFSEQDRLAEYTTDNDLIDNALRNSLPMITEHAPSLQKLAGEGYWPVARVAFVSCWLHFKDKWKP